MKTMKIEVTSSTMVKPMESRASSTLWLSNMDLRMPTNFHTPIALFYRSTGSTNFFNMPVLKAALSRALVEFNPAAGRRTEVEIICSGEGALLLEAETDGTVDDLGDFTGIHELHLIPVVDYSGGISTVPLLLIQVTSFKCGGVCIGVAIDHKLADGYSAIHFIKAWSQIAGGLDITVVPSVDRSVLAARSPPQPQFPHVEYQKAPVLKSNAPDHNYSGTILSIFKITSDQLNALKNSIPDNGVTYSSFTVLTGHVWRCVTKARALPEDQETLLILSVNGRSRIQPPLPQGYFGNAVFGATSITLCGELDSNPLAFATRKIYDAIARVDDDYMRSAIDYLELKPSMSTVNRYKCPNLAVISWAHFGVHEIDFGWGKPVFMGYCRYIPEGITFVLPSPKNDGSLLYAISLPKQQMQVFEHLFYNI